MVAAGLKRHRVGVDAEAVVGGVLDEGLGVDCAGEMHVKVCALGHTSKECIQFERTVLLTASKARMARCSFGVVAVVECGGG